MKLASCKSALTAPPPPHPHPTVVYSTDRSKAVVPALVLLFAALWFILRGDLFYVLPCVILFLCFSVLLALRLPRFSYVCSICACLVLSVSSLSWCLGRAAVCDCGTPRTFPLPFYGTAHVTRVLQKVLSLGSDYFSATFYQTYFHYKPSKYSPFTETQFCNLFSQSRKADK